MENMKQSNLIQECIVLDFLSISRPTIVKERWHKVKVDMALEGLILSNILYRLRCNIALLAAVTKA